MTQTDSIEITVNLEKKDAVALFFHALTKRTMFKIMIASVIICLILTLFTASLSNSAFPYEFVIIMLALVGLLPLLIYYIAGKEYESNQRLRETITYYMDRENIRAKGESFDSTMTWEKTNDLTETKNYFFIWQSKNTANIIPKKYLNTYDISFLHAMRHNLFSTK